MPNKRLQRTPLAAPLKHNSVRTSRGTRINKLKNIGILLAVLVAGTQLVDWMTAPSDQLTATVEFGPFQLPSQYLARFEALDRLGSPESLAALAELDDVYENRYREENELAYEALSGSARGIRDAVGGLAFQSKLLDGLWSITITNESDRALSEVTLNLPDTAQYLTTKREGRSAEHSESIEVVSLGSMRPRESATLRAWTLIEGSRYSAESTSITHSSGVGEIIVRAPATSSLAIWIDENSLGLALFIFWLASMFLIFRSTILRPGRKPAQEPAESSQIGIDENAA